MSANEKRVMIYLNPGIDNRFYGVFMSSDNVPLVHTYDYPNQGDLQKMLRDNFPDWPVRIQPPTPGPGGPQQMIEDAVNPADPN